MWGLEPLLIRILIFLSTDMCKVESREYVLIIFIIQLRAASRLSVSLYLHGKLGQVICVVTSGGSSTCVRTRGGLVTAALCQVSRQHQVTNSVHVVCI